MKKLGKILQNLVIFPLLHDFQKKSRILESSTNKQAQSSKSNHTKVHNLIPLTAKKEEQVLFKNV